jgi:putative membrane protein
MSDLRVATGSDRFEVRVTADSHFAWLRTRFALERTMMAVLRTGISLIGFGFAIVQFFAHLQQNPAISAATYPMAPEYLGMALIATGVFAIAFSIWWYFGMVRYLWEGPYSAIAGSSEARRRAPITGISIVLIGIGLFAFFAVLFRLV